MTKDKYVAGAYFDARKKALIAAGKYGIRRLLGDDMTDFNIDARKAAWFEDHVCPDADSVATFGEGKLRATTRAHEARIKTAILAVIEAARAKRAFQIENGILRNHIEADPLNSILKIGCLWLGESGLYGILALSDGAMPGGASALGFGATMAGSTSALAILAGTFTRYSDYGLNAPNPTQMMAAKRRMGRFVSGVAGCGIAGLVLLSSIVRTTGETQLSFTFDTVSSVLTNFNTYPFAAIATCSAVFTARESKRILGDPYPGMDDACGAHSKAKAKLKDAIQDAHAELEDIFDDAMARLAGMEEDIADKRDELKEWLETAHEEREVLLQKIGLEEARLAAEVADFENHKHMLDSDGDEDADDAPDVSYLESLRAELAEIVAPKSDPFKSFAPDHKKAVNRIAEAFGKALEDISAAQIPAQPSPANSNNQKGA